MIASGVDAHQRAHLAVAPDATGREVAQWRGPNSPAGWQHLLIWGTARGARCRWGVEGARNDGRGMAGHLVAAGAAGDGANPRWTARARRRARKPDKRDRLDARAVALLAWREAGALPAGASDDAAATLDLLVSEREDRAAETARPDNQAQHLLLQRDPDDAPRLPTPQALPRSA